MRTPTRFIFPLVALGGLAVACDSPTAPAPSPEPAAPAFNVAANSASVLMDLEAGFCGLFDGDGNLAFGVSKLNVITNNSRGNALHKCQLDVPNPAGRAVHYGPDNNPLGSGVGCFISDGVGGFSTLNWHETVSASGKATLTCHNP